jgi:hypothetical protein
MAATFRETGAIQNPAYRPTGKFPLFALLSEPSEIKGGTLLRIADHVHGNRLRKGVGKQRFLTIR